MSLFPTGAGGILYPPGALAPEVTKREIFMADCPHADDVWFKAMAMRNGTPTTLPRPRSVQFPAVRRAQRTSLWQRNVEGGENDTQLALVFDRYNLWDRIPTHGC